MSKWYEVELIVTKSCMVEVEDDQNQDDAIDIAEEHGSFSVSMSAECYSVDDADVASTLNEFEEDEIIRLTEEVVH